MKVLLDTNIVMDILELRMPYATRALELFECDCEYCVTATTITDLYYLTRKNSNAKEVLREFVSNITVLSINKTICCKAFDSKIKDYEDAVQEQAAKYHGVSVIISRDERFINSDSAIQICTPSEWLRKVH